MTYLHGVKTTRTKSGTTPIQGVDTAIIGLVGTAPIFEVDSKNRTVNEIVEVDDSTEAVKLFGTNHEGYTIPAALEAIYNQNGGPTVYVINVFDPDKHKKSVADAANVFAGGKITLTDLNVTNLVVKKDGTALVLDTDYTFADNIISVKAGGKLSAADSVAVSYTCADVTLVKSADIIGKINTDETKTGIEKLYDCKAIFGKKAKILIAPVFVEANEVRIALETMEDKLKAVSYADAPLGTLKADAIKGRNIDGTINFLTENPRTMLAFPHVKVYNSTESVTSAKGLSAYMAGLRAYVDKNEGIQCSTSNHKINGISGVEVPVSFDLTDDSCDANKLNAAGITTVINCGEYRLWGNRNASFPSNADVDSFECILRTADYIDESIENASMQYVDKPITNAIIDKIVRMGQAFLDDLKNPAKQVIIDGKCWYDPSKNSTTEIAKGHIIISRKFIPPTPLENPEYESDIDINLYKTIGTQAV